MARIVGAIALLLVLTACSSGPAATSGGVDTGSMAGAAASAEAAGEGAQPVTDASASNAAGAQVLAAQNAQAPTQRLVIRTATLRLLVDRVIEVEPQVRKLAEDRGGFVLSSQASGDDTNRSATITFKVPAERFDDAINDLARLSRSVEAQDVQGQDVTDEFVDLESRLRNLRAVETRLLDLLRGATTTEAALQVNTELADIQGQIEAAVGRINYLKQSAALSTITVTLRSEPIISLVSEPTWSPLATARTAASGLIEFGQDLANLVIVAAVWAPVWVPLLLLGLWVRRKMRQVDSLSTPTPNP